MDVAVSQSQRRRASDTPSDRIASEHVVDLSHTKSARRVIGQDLVNEESHTCHSMRVCTRAAVVARKHILFLTTSPESLCSQTEHSDKKSIRLPSALSRIGVSHVVIGIDVQHLDGGSEGVICHVTVNHGRQDLVQSLIE